MVLSKLLISFTPEMSNIQHVEHTALQPIIIKMLSLFSGFTLAEKLLHFANFS